MRWRFWASVCLPNFVGALMPRLEESIIPAFFRYIRAHPCSIGKNKLRTARQ